LPVALRGSGLPLHINEQGTFWVKINGSEIERGFVYQRRMDESYFKRQKDMGAAWPQH
jgi:hypothetical protein